MSISQLQANEMIARCERNKRRSSPDPYACPDAYAVAEQRFQYLPGFEYSKGAEKISPNNCAVIERTGDGQSVGPCTFYLENGIRCPRHGVVREKVTEQRETGTGGIQNQIERWLRQNEHSLKIMWTKNRTDQKSSCELGRPDFVGSYQGRAWAIEAKRCGQKPTIAQQGELLRWKMAGAITGVAHDLAEFKALLGIE